MLARGPDAGVLQQAWLPTRIAAGLEQPRTSLPRCRVWDVSGTFRITLDHFGSRWITLERSTLAKEVPTFESYTSSFSFLSFEAFRGTLKLALGLGLAPYDFARMLSCDDHNGKPWSEIPLLSPFCHHVTMSPCEAAADVPNRAESCRNLKMPK